MRATIVAAPHRRADFGTIQVSTPSRSARSIARSSCRRDSSRSRRTNGEVRARGRELHVARALRARQRFFELPDLDVALLRRGLRGERVLLGGQTFGAQLLLLRRGVVEDLGVELLLLELRFERGEGLFEAEAELLVLALLLREALAEALGLEARGRGVERRAARRPRLTRCAGAAADAQHARFDGRGDDLLDQRDDGARRPARVASTEPRVDFRGLHVFAVAARAAATRPSRRERTPPPRRR